GEAVSVIFITAKAIAGERPEFETAELEHPEADVIEGFDLDGTVVADTRRGAERKACDLIGPGALELRAHVDATAHLPAVPENAKRIVGCCRLGESGRRNEPQRHRKCGHQPPKMRTIERHRKTTAPQLNSWQCNEFGPSGPAGFVGHARIEN